MTKTEYRAYISSPEWKERRKLRLEEGENACEKCKLPRWLASIAYDQDLHVHHLSYANIGQERFDDLEVLCRRCHEIETFGRSELKAPKNATCEVCGNQHWNPWNAFCDVCEALLINGRFGDFLSSKKLEDVSCPTKVPRQWFDVAWAMSAYSCYHGGPPMNELLEAFAYSYFCLTSPMSETRGEAKEQFLAQFRQTIAPLRLVERYAPRDDDDES